MLAGWVKKVNTEDNTSSPDVKQEREGKVGNKTYLLKKKDAI